jgi:nucleotide-binding universal stress UspA family protein
MTATAPPTEAVPARQPVYLVVVDKTPEMRVALRYACRQAARNGGRVALLAVIEPATFEHWAMVRDRADDEQRAEGEQTLKHWATLAKEWSGAMPMLHLRQGSVRQQIEALMAEEQAIAGLVLGAGTGPEGPGPIVSSLASRFSEGLRVPITIVPGGLTDQDVDALA